MYSICNPRTFSFLYPPDYPEELSNASIKRVWDLALRSDNRPLLSIQGFKICIKMPCGFVIDSILHL